MSVEITDVNGGAPILADSVDNTVTGTDLQYTVEWFLTDSDGNSFSLVNVRLDTQFSARFDYGNYFTLPQRLGPSNLFMEPAYRVTDTGERVTSTGAERITVP